MDQYLQFNVIFNRCSKYVGMKCGAGVEKDDLRWENADQDCFTVSASKEMKIRIGLTTRIQMNWCYEFCEGYEVAHSLQRFVPSRYA